MLYEMHKAKECKRCERLDMWIDSGDHDIIEFQLYVAYCGA